jgi:hypothetical protein
MVTTFQIISRKTSYIAVIRNDSRHFNIDSAYFSEQKLTDLSSTILSNCFHLRKPSRENSAAMTVLLDRIYKILTKYFIIVACALYLQAS